MKLIINTCVQYRPALQVCIKSLVSTAFDISEHSVVIIMGGAEEDAIPCVVCLSTLVDIQSDALVTLVRMKLQNFDYHGLHALQLHHTHKLIFAKHYMYVLDTVSFHPSFNASFIAVERRMLNNNDDKVILGPEPPNANICAFASGIITWKDTYATLLSKGEAIRVEMGHVEKGVRPIYSYGHRLHWPKRIRDGIVEGYVDKNITRRSLFYPGFGLWKYALWGRHGDMCNDVRENVVE